MHAVEQISGFQLVGIQQQFQRSLFVARWFRPLFAQPFDFFFDDFGGNAPARSQRCHSSNRTVQIAKVSLPTRFAGNGELQKLRPSFAAEGFDPAASTFDAGAGLTYQKPPAGANDGSDWIFTGANNVGTAAGPVGTTQAASGNDLIMLMANANAALCLQINRDLEVGTSGTIPEDTTGIVTTEFTGTYADSLDIIDGDPTPFELDRKSAGCFTDTAANPDVTYFYYVLLAR